MDVRLTARFHQVLDHYGLDSSRIQPGKPHENGVAVDEERNQPAAARLAEERAFLRPLPAARVPEYTTFRCRVRKWSTIRIGSRI